MTSAVAQASQNLPQFPSLDPFLGPRNSFFAQSQQQESQRGLRQPEQSFLSPRSNRYVFQFAFSSFTSPSPLHLLLPSISRFRPLFSTCRARYLVVDLFYTFSATFRLCSIDFRQVSPFRAANTCSYFLTSLLARAFIVSPPDRHQPVSDFADLFSLVQSLRKPHLRLCSLPISILVALLRF